MPPHLLLHNGNKTGQKENVACMVSQKTTGPVGPSAANGMKYTHVLFYDGLHEKASPAVPCRRPRPSPLFA